MQISPDDVVAWRERLHQLVNELPPGSFMEVDRFLVEVIEAYLKLQHGLQ